MICPKIHLFQQYQKSEPVRRFFDILKNWWQDKWFTNVDSVFVDNLNVYNNPLNTDYIEFVARNKYGLLRPINFFGADFWDKGSEWDKAYWDLETTSNRMNNYSFRKYLLVCLNQTLFWNVVSLYKMVFSFCDIEEKNYKYVTIEVGYTPVGLSEITISIPYSQYAVNLASCINNYHTELGLPIGTHYIVVITEAR